MSFWKLFIPLSLLALAGVVYVLFSRIDNEGERGKLDGNPADRRSFALERNRDEMINDLSQYHLSQYSEKEKEERISFLGREWAKKNPELFWNWIDQHPPPHHGRQQHQDAPSPRG